MGLSRATRGTSATNRDQAIAGTVNYDAFGQTVGTTGSSSNPYMFAATSRYRNDGDAGLMLVGARYYDAQVGRFITRDTDLDEHPYLYCEHDPVNALDPSGHDGVVARLWKGLKGLLGLGDGDGGSQSHNNNTATGGKGGNGIGIGGSHNNIGSPPINIHMPPQGGNGGGTR